MIKIELKNGAPCKTLNELSNEYYALVKLNISKKASAILDIYNFCVYSNAIDVKSIHGGALPKILSIFTNQKIELNGEKLNTNDLKIEFINKFRNHICVDFKTKSNKTDFSKLLKFIKGEIPINGYTVKLLITEEPVQLEIISKSLNTQFNSIINQTGVVKFLEYIFDYSDIHSDKSLRKLFSDNLAINVCPYCNRNYISYIEHNETKIIGPTLDHFLAKSIHPFLASSFYNLVPSCYVCNSNLKGKKETKLTEHLNPFIEGFGEVAKFKLTNNHGEYGAILEIDYTNPISERIYPKPLKNKSKEKKNYKGNAALFKINEIYSNGHNDDISLIVNNCNKVSKYYNDNLSKVIKTHATISEFYKFHFNNFLEENYFNRKPLSKLTRDLVNERLPWLF